MNLPLPPAQREGRLPSPPPPPPDAIAPPPPPATLEPPPPPDVDQPPPPPEAIPLPIDGAPKKRKAGWASAPKAKPLSVEDLLRRKREADEAASKVSHLCSADASRFVHLYIHRPSFPTKTDNLRSQNSCRKHSGKSWPLRNELVRSKKSAKRS